uniref:Uncharacterized protein n=1 Tax=Glossina pallidipes TaxID=7398 RepID=A0A1A9ZC66_GLOPL
MQIYAKALCVDILMFSTRNLDLNLFRQMVNSNDLKPFIYQSFKAEILYKLHIKDIHATTECSIILQMLLPPHSTHHLFNAIHTWSTTAIVLSVLHILTVHKMPNTMLPDAYQLPQIELDDKD